MPGSRTPRASGISPSTPDPRTCRRDHLWSARATCRLDTRSVRRLPACGRSPLHGLPRVPAALPRPPHRNMPGRRSGRAGSIRRPLAVRGAGAEVPRGDVRGDASREDAGGGVQAGTRQHERGKCRRHPDCKVEAEVAWLRPGRADRTGCGVEPRDPPCPCARTAVRRTPPNRPRCRVAAEPPERRVPPRPPSRLARGPGRRRRDHWHDDGHCAAGSRDCGYEGDLRLCCCHAAASRAEASHGAMTPDPVVPEANRVRGSV